jgi:hypothetical protein
MTNLPEISGADKKGWRAENYIDLAIKGGAVGAVLYFWGSIAPFLVSMLDNTIHLAIGAAALVGILYVFFDPKVRNLVRASYDLAIRKATGFVVERDPIGIMKNYVAQLMARKDDMQVQITKLRGEKRKLADAIKETQGNAQLEAQRATKARELNNAGAAGVSANKVGRAKASLEQMIPLHDKMAKLEVFLNKMYESIGYMVEDISDEVTNRERMYKIIKAAHGAITSAAAAMGGDRDQRAMFEMATEAVKDDVAMRVGYMEQFIEESTNFINKIDVDNAVFEDNGTKLIEQFQSGEMDWLFAPLGNGAAKPQAVKLQAGQPGVINIAPAGQPEQLTSRSSLFD